MTEVYALDLTAGAPSWQAGKGWHWREPVGYLFLGNWASVARLHLSSRQVAVLLALFRHCDWGNRCQVTSAQLGRDAGLHRQTVARALRVLALRQLLIVDSTPRQSDQTILLSPALCWKGRPWHLAHARQQFLAAWRLRYALPALVAPTTALHAVPAAVLPGVGGEPPPTRVRDRELPHLSPTPLPAE